MSHLAKIWAELLREDPRAGKVSNAQPNQEFAFEIEGRHTVAEVMNLPDGEAAQKLRAVDDDGQPVTEVPLGSTSRSFHFHFLDRLIDLPYAKPTISPSLLVECLAGIIALKIVPHPQAFGLQPPLEELLQLPFHRFYYHASEAHWTVTFATWECGA